MAAFCGTVCGWSRVLAFFFTSYCFSCFPISKNRFELFKKLFSNTIFSKLVCDSTGTLIYFRENFFSGSSQHHRPAAHAAQPEAEEPPSRYPVVASTTRGHPGQRDEYSSGGHRSHHPDRYDSSPERSSYHDTSSRLSGGHLPRRGDSPPRSEYHSRHTVVWIQRGFTFCPVQSFQTVPDSYTVNCQCR
jgi:hypothetical protein